MKIFPLLALLACSSPPATRPTPPPPADRDLTTAVDAFVPAHLAFRPTFAIDLGLHDHDGRVPDRSPRAIEDEIKRLHAARTTFEAIDETRLSKRARAERGLVLAEIRKELFELATRRAPYRNPFHYLFRFSLNSYIARDYAPAARRAAAMLRACEAAPAYYRQAIANLEPALPRPWLQAGMMIAGGTVQFLTGDAKRAFPDDAKLAACLDALAVEVGAFAKALESRLPAATDDFRLGADSLIAMLREGDGLEIDIARLEQIANADLERNYTAIVAAAKAIDPTRDAAVVIAEASADKPDNVIDEATAQVAALRQAIVDKQIVSLPRPDPIEVRESPPFMRGNFAALGGVGPFETTPQPSFYYIAPPDPKWPADQQRAYVMSRADMLFTTAHEVFPGHFVQGMHERASGSRVLQTFETYLASEGWAHYVEEMMWEQGVGNRDPRMHIGQLKNALLRNVRFVVALGYHAKQMTVDEATKLFVAKAFADPKTAQQQALRGTLDPYFLGYTLGKLIIRELRADWQRAHPDNTLRDFHDELLSYGEAPLPVIRRLMLGDAAGSPLAATRSASP